MRIKSKKIKTKADLSPSSGGASYDLVKPGFYGAIVTKMEPGQYRAKYKGHANPDSEDGKWTYLKIIPSITLLNDAHTRISRQDLTVGALDSEGYLVRPDGDESKLPTFGGNTGAQFLLQALGLFRKTDEEGGFELDFAPKSIVNRILRVRVSTGAFIKGERNFSPDALQKMLEETAGVSDYPFSKLDELVAKWNLDNGYIDSDGDEVEEGVLLRTKNVVTGYYALSDADARREDYIVEDGMVFQDEEAYAFYEALREEDTEEDPDW